MTDRMFIVGLPYRTSKGYAFNLVKDNRTRIYMCHTMEQASYLSSLATILNKAGIDFDFS